MTTHATLLTPQFFGMLEPGALELCDFFYLPSEAAVPVERFAITADGRRHEFAVKFDTYKPALILLYLAVMAKGLTYPIGPEAKKLLTGYYGQELVENARKLTSGDTVLHRLLGVDAVVELELRGSYTLPESKGRTLEEMIRYAWDSREILEPDSVSPLVRQAVHLFLEGERLHLLPICDTADPDVWPSRIWKERVHQIAQRIHYHRAPIAA